MVIRKLIISQKIWILSLLEKKSSAFIINFCYWKRGISATHLPLCSFVLNFDFWAKLFLLGNGEFTKRPFSYWLNSSCKHAIKQKKKTSLSKRENAVLNNWESFLAFKNINPGILSTFERSFSTKTGKTPIRLLESPTSLTVYIVIVHTHVQLSALSKNSEKCSSVSDRTGIG